MLVIYQYNNYIDTFYQHKMYLYNFIFTYEYIFVFVFVRIDIIILIRLKYVTSINQYVYKFVKNIYLY